MPAELLSQIWQRLDSEPPIFLADEIRRSFGNALAPFLALGLLSETTPAFCAPCWDCGRGFVGQVEFLVDRSTGNARPCIHCPECGVKQVPMDRLRRWTVDLDRSIAVVADAAAIRGPATASIPGHFWRLGRGIWCGRSVDVYLARCVHESSRGRITEALAAHPKAVVFSPTHHSAERLRRAIPNSVVSLEAAVTFNEGKLVFDAAHVEQLLLERSERRPSRPTPKRARRAAKIQKLVAALVEHLRSARDHAFSTKERTGTPALLRRPSQQELAKLTGLTKSDATRCLKDETARELRILWDLAADIDQIMAWTGRAQSRRAR